MTSGAPLYLCTLYSLRVERGKSLAAIGFAVSASGHSMEMKGVDLFRFENGLIKEVWLFSERIDEEDRFWTALAQG